MADETTSRQVREVATSPESKETKATKKAQAADEEAPKSPVSPRAEDKKSTASTADEIRKRDLDRDEPVQSAPENEKAKRKARVTSPLRGDVDTLVKSRDKTDSDGNAVMDDEERAAVNALEQANEQYEQLKAIQKRRKDRS